MRWDKTIILPLTGNLGRLLYLWTALTVLSAPMMCAWIYQHTSNVLISTLKILSGVPRRNHPCQILFKSV